MLNITRKLEAFSCVEHLIMFSSTSKLGVDECRAALINWLEDEKMRE